MKDLLVVIDMVNGFINQGALADNKIKKIVPLIIDNIENAKNKNMDIVAFKDCHSEDDEEFKIFPKHCLKGSFESELIMELSKYKDDMMIIDKDTTNGFVTTKFFDLINKNTYNNVYVCGCCTDICVQNFVESYLSHIKQNSVDTTIKVIKNACYTFDNDNHNADTEHEKSINYMQSLGAKII
ncbi:MAG: cysteine hydrolase [Clostridia bacterium]|nr:cysteine hydrolase [Clostridia bacterium]